MNLAAIIILSIVLLIALLWSLFLLRKKKLVS